MPVSRATLLVGESELRQRLRVARVVPHGVLELDDEALRVAERESGERVVRRHGGGLVPACVDGRGRRVAAQHPAEEAADAEQSGDSCRAPILFAVIALPECDEIGGGPAHGRAPFGWWPTGVAGW